ncbi:uncharacterized protein LOC105389072 isoform X1 [Plutella xylostella]|uniref:uncharacterized protein LOC105389072 isoform X1 n=1 Tax=Plutella xylostella TaxID=51655 RepID=UPI002032CF6A|nr:uncharacterized protein LOC105389072 isoform X1 [Plutella xylostella]
MEAEKELLQILEDKISMLQKVLVNFKKCPKARLTKGYITVRLQTIQEYWRDFTNAHLALTRKVPKQNRQNYPYFANDEYYEVEELYLGLQADLNDLLSECSPSATSRQSAGAASTNMETADASQVKLPRIQLPTFSGSYEEFPAFKDLFTSLVDNNVTLSNVQKLHYLKSSIKGEPESLLKHMQVVECNYEPAWKLLQERYNNMRLITNSVLKRLFNQRKISAPTADNIRSLLDTTNDCLNSLRNLSISTDSWDPVIIFLVIQKLDPESHQEWEQSAFNGNSAELPKWTELSRFLETKYRTLELVNPPQRQKITQSQNREREYKVLVSTDTNSNNNYNNKEKYCSMCKENHTLCHCREFISKVPRERCEFVKSNQLCFNCLAPGHSAFRCRLRMFCRVCKKRHHTLLHETYQPNNVECHHDTATNENNNNNEPVSELSTNIATNTSTALLATALVPVRDESSGRVTMLRALIDNGSQASFISERAAQLLKLKRIPCNGTITGVGTTKTTVKHVAQIEVLSSQDNKFSLKLKVYVMPTRLTSQLPTRVISERTWSHIHGIALADPGFNQPGPVDMLLGVEVCAAIMKGEIIKGPPGTPSAQNTSLGWILFGHITSEEHRDEYTVMHHQIDLEINSMLKQMWELNDHEQKILTAEERRCEEIYESNHSRTEDGRYIVKLPFKTENRLSIQNGSRDIALRSLKQLERRFEKNQKLKEEYTKVIEEYLEMEHMEEVPIEEINKPAVYLPHHAVMKEEKETSKCRVVFNASCKGTNNTSLNDELLVGPQLQEDMRSIIMRWRMHKVCFAADAVKMYRMILITEEDKDNQRILWRKSRTEPVKDYRLNRVTFGTASAPYLAVKTLLQLAKDEGHINEEAAKIIKEDCFMDDIVSGKETLKDAIKTAKDIEKILQKGGFILQKWCSNDVDFLKQFEPSKISTHVNIKFGIDGIIKTLGIIWNMGEDVFQYQNNLPATAESYTKRSILAEIQKLFDPLGWIAPAIIPAKILMQRLWLQRTGWDEDVDEEAREEWIELREKFQELDQVQVKRWHETTESNRDHTSIHGFCDASTKAYAAVAYLRVEDKEGNVTTNIIAAKTRVAPLKPVTLPRLELCGAVLLAKMLKQIREAMRISESKVHAWTDSTIVLSWLSGDPARWNTFVRNRVVTILDDVNNNWHHVQTHENPADVATRGIEIGDLKEHKLWWKGPQWLREKEVIYSKPAYLETNLEKREKIKINTTIVNEDENIEKQFENMEDLTQLLIVITHCRRFMRYKKDNLKERPITTKELNESLNACIKIVQRNNFEEEINRLKENLEVKRESKLSLLKPYMDNEGIVRVGGRLRHANIEEDRKHPIIIPSEGYLTTLIIADAHAKTLHGGIQLMLEYLRSKYWILKVKNLVKTMIRNCLICAKQRALVRNQLMGDLPTARVNPARPFYNSGVDFAGPYQATKAIHLELVGDLTSEAYIGAYRRFISRRGRCSHLWSDQGRNFIGADKELKTALKEAKLDFEGDIAETLAKDGTQWHFIPGYSPHMGGLWEAGVKSMKYHMKRILTSHLTFEEMSTLLCQIEACLNSRPISTIESESETITLTPGHFLIGEAPVTVPNPDLKSVKVSRLTRWQHLQKLLSDFWQIWQSEYLARLQQRPKWLKKVQEFEKGQIVLIKTENLPPGKWSLGRIVDKHPGADGVTRVYSVKSGNSVVQRPMNKLCYLPIDTAT